MEKVTITISVATLAAIGQGLSELPYKIAASAVAEIDKQLLDQQKAQQNDQRPAPTPPKE